ncbi:hypothetical protein [Brasilonema sp. UFV-L1]|uniref:hypothetical protein n=1 Tax=Brasilonema sp. UFV-L1 TaxID=2234130 RepID=UPI00145D0E07|nr:hypothetical protein [Brasilonema sp. UFV-L1]NMG09132.1 hypothetical protein [Brasilonema sp. UFV-L1]
MARLELISLYCEKTEDTVGSDEIYFVINGNQVGGVNTINAREGKDLRYISNIIFDRTAEIALYDKDTGIFNEDDLVGSVTATSGQVGEGEITAKFSRGGSDYTLTWRVLA